MGDSLTCDGGRFRLMAPKIETTLIRTAKDNIVEANGTENLVCLWFMFSLMLSLCADSEGQEV